MKKHPKLSLSLDALRVESFATGEGERAGRGTVHARQGGGGLTRRVCTAECSGDVTCARLLSEYATCVVNCECTNAQVKCLYIPP